MEEAEFPRISGALRATMQPSETPSRIDASFREGWLGVLVCQHHLPGSLAARFAVALDENPSGLEATQRDCHSNLRPEGLSALRYIGFDEDSDENPLGLKVLHLDCHSS